MKTAYATAPGYWHYWSWKSERGSMGSRMVRGLFAQGVITYNLQDPGRLLHLMRQYFEKVGDKVCCFDDLKPYQILEGEDSAKWTSFLESVTEDFVCRCAISVQNNADVTRFRLMPRKYAA